MRAAWLKEGGGGLFILIFVSKEGCIVACVTGPQFYGGPDLQRAGF